VKGAKALPALLVALTATACGNSSDSYSFVAVTVTAPSDMLPAVQLRADITHAGKSDSELFPKGQPTAALTFDASFALALPKSRTGALDITVSALDSTGRVVGTGAGSVQIVVGGRADKTIHLALPNTADAGALDTGMGTETGDAGTTVPLDTATIDTPSLADVLPTIDGSLGQETLAYDATVGPDVPLTGGTGGAGGVGGQGGVGGGIDAGTGGAGGGMGRDAGLDLGNLGGSGGISSAGGAGGSGGISSTGGAGAGGAGVIDASSDTAGVDGSVDNSSAGGAGGVSTTGGAGGVSTTGGAGGVSTTGGAGGVSSGGAGGTTTLSDAGLPDAPPSICSATVSCPSYQNCQGQPICNLATGICSAPSQCSVCGNGILEFSEQCDDGNTVSGDHCSSTCKDEFCGDGIIQSKVLTSLSFVYLARSCGVVVPQDIWFLLNHVEVARGTVKQTCDCQPGIVTLTVTNPAFLALGKNGNNVVEVHTAAEISWAIAHHESPSGPGDDFLVDYGSNGAAEYRRPNLCTNGSQQGAGIAVGMTLAGGEQCDDGNSNGVGTDPCSTNCTLR
jgi:cysteine-rich repeat protein